MIGRREWFAALAAGPVAAQTGRQPGLPLEDYEPRSMLRVEEHPVPRARFPVIDAHTHLSKKVTPRQVLAVMDRKNIRTMIHLTGGWGRELEQDIAYWHTPHPERFLVFTEPAYKRSADAGYAKFQAGELERARRAGARGLKVTKMLGLYLREKISTGPLVKVDDPRFDLLWDAAGALDMPVAIHTSDPEAFFLPIDRYNERYEELHAHPDWSFHGHDFPASRELHEARKRVIARHPRTQFLLLHMGVAEDLAYMADTLDRYPNTWVEFGARIGELGRQPRAARKFFDRYQDRILFGTDAIPLGEDTPQQVFNDRLYEIYYRFLETGDEYFDYAPARTPPQGRWRISGLGLPEPILQKVYQRNAIRLLQLG